VSQEQQLQPRIGERSKVMYIFNVLDGPIIETGDGVAFSATKVDASIWWNRASVKVSGRTERDWSRSRYFNLYGTKYVQAPVWLMQLLRDVGYYGDIEGEK
jgi:hypothetical protein